MDPMSTVLEATEHPFRDRSPLEEVEAVEEEAWKPASLGTQGTSKRLGAKVLLGKRKGQTKCVQQLQRMMLTRPATAELQRRKPSREVRPPWAHTQDDAQCMT